MTKYSHHWRWDEDYWHQDQPSSDERVPPIPPRPPVFVTDTHANVLRIIAVQGPPPSGRAWPIIIIILLAGLVILRMWP